MEYDFRLQTNSRAELEKVTDLLRRVWPKIRRFNLPYIEWLYRDNPDGGAIGYNAFYGDEVAAHYVVIPFQVEFASELRKSALALNAGVDERHRGQSLFRKLAEMTHLRSLGFQLVTPLDVRMCLTLPRPSGARIEWQWRRKWSAEGLAWRLKNPSGRYWLAGNGAVSWILGTTKYRGVRAILKVESDLLMLGQAERQLPRRVTWPPVLWFGLSPELKFSASVEVPMRIRPSPFNLVFHDLSSRHRWLMPGRVHFEAADFDVM
jgi:hypothetical protein